MSNPNDKKFVIVDGQAYNEDNIKIYNINISNLPKSANKKNVSAYCSKFGKVLDVGFLGNGKGNGKKCYVNFRDSKAAAKALTKAYHSFLGCNVAVDVCQSCLQPSGRSAIEQLNGRSKNDCIPKNICTDSSYSADYLQVTILSLNDDCLRYICQNLSLNDQINFALTCQRFRDSFKMLSYDKYVNFSTDVFKSLTKYQSIIFLQIVDTKIKNLTVEFNCHYFDDLSFIKFFSSFCTTVESLIIDENTMHPSKIHALIENMPLLKKLEFKRVEVGVSLMKFLKSLKYLKRLDITCTNEVTGQNIHLLTGLEELSLFQCISVTPFHFKKICQDLKNLHYLDITFCSLLKTPDFEEILKYLHQLDTLKFSTSSENYNCLARLPKLKRLEIDDLSCHGITIEFLQLLLQHHSERLEELKVTHAYFIDEATTTLLSKLKKLKYFCFENISIKDKGLKKFETLSELEKLDIINCKSIQDEDVLQLLENCHKLTHLNLTRCKCLTPTLIIDANKLLVKQNVRSLRLNLPVHIILSSKRSTLSTKDEIATKYNTDVLKVTFDYVNHEDRIASEARKGNPGQRVIDALNDNLGNPDDFDDFDHLLKDKLDKPEAFDDLLRANPSHLRAVDVAFNGNADDLRAFDDFLNDNPAFLRVIDALNDYYELNL